MNNHAPPSAQHGQAIRLPCADVFQVQPADVWIDARVRQDSTCAPPAKVDARYPRDTWGVPSRAITRATTSTSQPSQTRWIPTETIAACCRRQHPVAGAEPPPKRRRRSGADHPQQARQASPERASSRQSVIIRCEWGDGRPGAARIMPAGEQEWARWSLPRDRQSRPPSTSSGASIAGLRQ
jgi:hypothetical protein